MVSSIQAEPGWIGLAPRQWPALCWWAS